MADAPSIPADLPITYTLPYGVWLYIQAQLETLPYKEIRQVFGAMDYQLDQQLRALAAEAPAPATKETPKNDPVS